MHREPESTTTHAPWTVGDFFIAIGAGLVLGVLGAIPFAVGIGELLVLGLFTQYIGHLLGVWFVVKRHKARWADLGLDVRPRDGLYIGAGLLLQVVLALLFYPIVVWLRPEGGAGQAITDLIPEVTGTMARAAIALGVVLLAPLVEELMFRGILMGALARRGARFALIISSLVFAVYHVFGLAEADPLTAAAIVIPEIFIVGLVLGRQVQKRRRLGTAIFTHAGFNLVATLVLMLPLDSLATP